MREARRSRSPYAKYGKKPYRYSTNYQRWRALTLKLGVTDTPEHVELNREHRIALGLPA